MMIETMPPIANIYPTIVTKRKSVASLKKPPPIKTARPKNTSKADNNVLLLFIPTLYYAFSLLSIVNLSNLLLAATAYTSVRS